MKQNVYNGELYNDDRIFVYNINQCQVEDTYDSIAYRIPFEKALDNPQWCLVMYRNTPDYRIVDVFHFESQEEAKKFLQYIEPRTPLISLNGEKPIEPLNYNDYVQWKKSNQFSEYDYRKVFVPFGGMPIENPTEIFNKPKGWINPYL